QEQIDPICAVNLNARFYDPTIARFMAADSIVPDAFNSQSLNRYSYVNNGPLSAVDPSGHDVIVTVRITAPGELSEGVFGGPVMISIDMSGGLRQIASRRDDANFFGSSLMSREADEATDTLAELNKALAAFLAMQGLTGNGASSSLCDTSDN